jgi:RecB family exonuclease
MSALTNRQQHLFIVRTWREPSTVVATSEWRGLVEHVSTGQRRYFTRLEDLDRFILQQMEESDEAAADAATPTNEQAAGEA